MSRTRIRIALASLACLMLAACTRHLPRSLHQSIAAEHTRLQQARQQFDQWNAHVKSVVAASPDLFRGVLVADQWRSRLEADDAKLKAAESDRKQLSVLAHRNRADLQKKVTQLLAEETGLRRAAMNDVEGVEAAASNWSDFAHNPSAYLAKMSAERAAIRKINLEPIEKTIAQAGKDWPAKLPVLESRLAALEAGPNNAEKEWAATAKQRTAAAHGKLSGPAVAALIQEDDHLTSEADVLPRDIAHLRDECGQLYVSWDKILADLDIEQQHGRNIYREKIETVTTRFPAQAAKPDPKRDNTTSSTEWKNISQAQFQAVQNDLGMAIAHKDAGKFDSEAEHTPQPAGFAYIAPPSQGMNHYGYWSHSGGEAFWTFFPQYLLLQQLMWGGAYRPIVIGEYDSYRSARTAGHTYYGRATPTSPPKYGSHGTFTARRYASSRYMKSGGFGSSRYSSHRRRGSTFSRGERGFGSSRGRRFGGAHRGRGFGRGLGRALGRGFGRRR